MSISSRITNMTTNISNAYDSLEKLGQTADNKNLENLSGLIDNIYDNAPKTEYQEGTEINLGKTIKGKLDYDNGVVGIGQSSQDSTNGYQLWGGFNNYSNQTFTTYSNGSIGCALNNQTANSATTGTAISNSLIKTLPAGTYTFSIPYLPTNLMCDLVKRNTGQTTGAVLKELKNDTLELTFTTTEEIEYFIRINVSSATTYSGTLYPMLEKGSTAHTWEQYTNGPTPNPSYPQQIKSVTGNQDVVVSGKNLYNDNAETEAYYYNASGEKVASPSASETYINLEYNLSDTAITISRATMVGSANIRICEYNGTAFIKRTLTTALSGETITLDSNTTRVIFSINKSSSAYFTNLMIEEGSTATTYEPYITPTSYQLSLGEYEFNAIGNYKDYIYKSGDSWYKHNAVGKDTLGQIFQYDSNNEIFYGPINARKSNTEETQNIYCDKLFWNGNFAGVGYTNTMENYQIAANNNGSSKNLFVKNSAYNASTTFNAWIASIGATIYYQLETETDTEITDETLLSQLEALYNAHSLNGTTIITSNGDLPMILKVRALSK